MNITQSDRSAIRSVVESQIQAFQAEDAALAFSFASPRIQQQFDTPEKFVEILKQDYPAVCHPRSAIFEQTRTFEGTLSQPVLLLGTDDRPVRALYLMEKQSDSSWRINGCILVPIERKKP